jgi:hypothetical protein
VFEQEWKGTKKEVTPQNATNFAYVNGSFAEIKDFMRTDVVLILEGVDDEQQSKVVGLLENN